MADVSKVRAVVATNLNLNSVKTLLFYYVLLQQLVKTQRHLRARGLSQTAIDFVRWVSQRVIMLALRMPAARKKVEAEMGKAKLDIEAKLVPKGADITRHLALPTDGKSLDWIDSEMEKMDVEMGKSTDWRLGKLSGAVYRTLATYLRLFLP
jgi:sphinganine-1-phosphate aldolase